MGIERALNAIVPGRQNRMADPRIRAMIAAEKKAATDALKTLGTKTFTSGSGLMWRSLWAVWEGTGYFLSGKPLEHKRALLKMDKEIKGAGIHAATLGSAAVDALWRGARLTGRWIAAK